MRLLFGLWQNQSVILIPCYIMGRSVTDLIPISVFLAFVENSFTPTFPFKINNLLV